MKDTESSSRPSYDLAELTQAVSECQQGNPKDLLELYHRYAYDKILRMFRQKVPSPMTSDDLANEVAIHVARPVGSKEFESIPRFVGFCVTIAQNIVKDWHRKYRKEDKVTGPSLDDGNESIGLSSDRYDLGTRQTTILRRLNMLPPRQAQAIRLEVAGYTGEEAAEFLGTNHNNFRGVLFRARRTARRLLADLNS